MLKYSVVSYQSGTTWLKIDGYKEGFHLGYFEGYIHLSEPHKSRSDRNRERFIGDLKNALNNSLREVKGFSPADFTFFNTIGNMLVFQDPYYGRISLTYKRVEESGQWIDVPIPEEILADFAEMMEHVHYCNNKGWD